MKRTLVLLILLGLSFSWANEYEKLLNKAAVLIKEGKNVEAMAPLKIVMKKRWKSEQGQRAVALMIEVCMAVGKKKEAENYTSRFLDFYPSSVYKERVKVSKAFQLVATGDFFSGAEMLASLLIATENKYLFQRSRHALLKILNAEVLNTGQLQELLENYAVDNQVVGTLMLQLAKGFVQEKRYKSARYYSRILQTRLKVKGLVDQAEQIESSLDSKGAGVPSVLVMAPLTGDFATFGNFMIQGAVIQAEKVNKSQTKFYTRYIDTRADPAFAVKKLRQILAQDSVVAVIGPMMSSTATAVASYLGSARTDIPMITPTATDEGIAALGPNIFQLNVPTSVLARRIARYSLECLGIEEFAILSPNTDYGHIMTREFTKMVDRHGGSILAVEFYEEGLEDYGKQFNRMRNRKFHLDQKRKRIAWGSDQTENFSPKEKRQWMEDSTLNFPGFFIPASDPTDAGILAAQWAFYKSKGQLLGSSGWYGRPTLIQGKKQVNGAYFSSAFLENSSSTQWQEFRKDFNKRWNSYPDKEKVAGLSYDAVGLVVKNLENKNLVMALRKTREYPGVYGTIKLDSYTGVNSNTHVVTVDKGKFTLSDECPEKK